MKQQKIYTSPATDTIAMATCNATLQTSNGMPQVSNDDTTVSYEQPGDSFGSDESVAAQSYNVWDNGWEE